MSEPRILLYDIETAHNIIAKFDLREEYTNHQNILQERFITCAAWKWLGEKKTYAVSVLDDPKRFAKSVADDRHVVKTLHKVISEADCIVAHNGDKFDIRWIRGRALKHGLSPLAPTASIDTLKIARRVFYLNSNRLDYIGKYLGFGGKTSTPPGLWLEALRGSRKAIRTMVSYNKRDVELLEQVFLKLRPFVPDHINRQLYAGDEKCPRCGSESIHARGWHASLTQKYRRFQCQSCKGWFRGRTAEKGKAAKVRAL